MTESIARLVKGAVTRSYREGWNDCLNVLINDVDLTQEELDKYFKLILPEND